MNMESQSKPEGNELLTWNDLRDHLGWWGRQLRNLFGFFGRVLAKHWLVSWPLMGILAFLAVAGLFFRSQKYQLSTTYVYNELHPKIFGDIGDKLNALIQYDRHDKVAAMMSLREAQAEKITGIQITDNRGKPLSDNYALRREPMVVTLTMSEPIAEDTLREALTSFLNSTPFTADRLEHKKELLRNELAFVKQKIQTVDSVVTNLYAESGRIPADRAQANVTIENATGKNAYELLSFSRELMKRKSQIENELFQPENVTPIDNFLVLPVARFNVGSVVKSSIAGAFIGFVLASLIVLVRPSLRS